MSKPQYAILRFAKYKGPEISAIEAHNERRKEKYASNPDVNPEKSSLNFHLIEPAGRYRAEAERQIAAAGCRTRTDSVRVVEALVTASPEFFRHRKRDEIQAFFEEALAFIKKRQAEETIISAVVHMDEKTPHMHLCFVPLTEDKRLSAKEILGNRKKLTKWQDEFWQHMTAKFPELERGETVSKMGRNHIPPRVFKEMTRLTKQREKLEMLLSDMNPFNAKSRAGEISSFLDRYIPAVEKMGNQLKKYSIAFTETADENKKLKEKNAELKNELGKSQNKSVVKNLQEMQLHQKYEDAKSILERIPPEIIKIYMQHGIKEKEINYEK